MSTPPDGSGTGRLIRKNVSALGLAYVAAGAFGFAAQAVLARTLGSETFGVYITAYSLVVIVGVVVRGKDEFVVRSGARDPSTLGSVIGDALTLQAWLVVIVAAVVAGIAAAIGFTGQGIAIAVLLALIVGADSATDAFRAGLQAVERLEWVAAISIGVSALSATLMIVAVVAGWGIAAAVGLSLAVSVVAIPTAGALCRRWVPLHRGRGAIAALVLLRASLPFTAIEVLTFAVGYSDALVIRNALGDSAAGAYGAAYRLIAAVGWIGVVFGSAVFRTMSSLAATDHAGFVRFVQRGVAGMMLVGLPLAAGGVLIGARLVPLIFGEEFAAGSPAMTVLTLSLPLSMAGMLAMLAIVAGDRPGSAAWILSIALVLNVALNVALVPRYGVVAAAWTTVASELLILAIALWTLSRRRVSMAIASMVVPGLAGALAVVAVVYPLRDAPLVAPLAAGAAAYALVLLAAGAPARLGLALPARRQRRSG